MLANPNKKNVGSNKYGQDAPSLFQFTIRVQIMNKAKDITNTMRLAGFNAEVDHQDSNPKRIAKITEDILLNIKIGYQFMSFFSIPRV